MGVNDVGKIINALKDTIKNFKSKNIRTDTDIKTDVQKIVVREIDVAFYVQYQGKEVCQKTILEKINEEWLKFHKLSEMKTLDVYLKVEEDTAYCLVNGDINIEFKLS